MISTYYIGVSVCVCVCVCARVRMYMEETHTPAAHRIRGMALELTRVQLPQVKSHVITKSCSPKGKLAPGKTEQGREREKEKETDRERLPHLWEKRHSA